jgi:UDP-2,3-diacylglucosamine pyrophosphatase LpxH
LRHDSAMHLIVVSDLHLGSRYCLSDAFLRFVAALPEASTLVLNGDVVHRPRAALPAAHQHVVDWLRRESWRRPVVWVLGNHDADYVMPEPGNITFCRDFAVGQRLAIVHGHTFDRLLPRLRWCRKLFILWYQVKGWRAVLPASPSSYAKEWAFLYGVFTRQVRRNAVQWARAQGFAAITCGHTHCPEDSQVKGVRYLNTGSWTEPPLCYVAVTPAAIQLKEARAACGLRTVSRKRAGRCEERVDKEPGTSNALE